MNKSGKIWGETIPIYIGSNIEMHRISINKGGTCSLHSHQSKFNGFYVICGELEIEVHKNDYNLIDKTILYDGDFTICKPGEYHRFIAKSDVEALEIYWTELNHNDIVRKDVGKIND